MRTDRTDTIRTKQKEKKRKQKLRDKRYGRSKAIENSLLAQAYSVLYAQA